MNQLALFLPDNPGPPEFEPLPALLEADMSAAGEFIRDAAAASTRRAYRSDWRLFTAWCTTRGAEPLPATPAIVAAFLATEVHRGTKAATITRRAAAIRYAHRLAGHEPPTSAEAVRATMKGIRRTIGTAKEQKAPATADLIMKMLAHMPDTLGGKRDRALIALGFAGAFRRSELVALTMADLVEAPDGYRVLIRHSKTDQEGQGQEVAIPRGYRLRPVEAVQTWLAAAEINDGPVFRPVKRYAELAGLDPALFAGHSLRAGFLTSAAEAGASVFKMMAVSRHRSVDTLQSYVRSADAFKDHAGAAFL
jgi:site-specific recombinase XerD